MTGQKKTIRRKNEYEIGTEYFDKEPLLYGKEKDHGQGLMLHSVGCPQPKASVFINSWNSPSYNNACVHGFIDGNDGTVY